MTKKKKKLPAREPSLEQLLFEAYQQRKGLLLSAEHVDALLFDDAIGTRITNKAAAEADLDEPGGDCVRSRTGETWEQFKRRLIAAME